MESLRPMPGPGSEPRGSIRAFRWSAAGRSGDDGERSP
ncbi:hypothetical protein X805_38600 [Sphaerotilus natans subsp. natans DSM 6575]|uniref:Uncharacterized protein n=1 Tax=Sphaerotilus natans subsp. natans DSM 6575 TaxID=1286631 RepID=A0A059KGG6_9BURK|nr:hypothetical protein X805_38600 [Sphaerotilus natans subsp. natans DSM 6575]